MECLYGSMQSAQEDSLLVKKGYEGRIENLKILLWRSLSNLMKAHPEHQAEAR